MIQSFHPAYTQRLLSEMITKSKETNGFPNDTIINYKIIRSRVYQKRSHSINGKQTPMLEIEPYLVEIGSFPANYPECMCPCQPVAEGLQFFLCSCSDHNTVKLVQWLDNPNIIILTHSSHLWHRHPCSLVCLDRLLSWLAASNRMILMCV